MFCITSLERVVYVEYWIRTQAMQVLEQSAHHYAAVLNN